MKSTAPSLVYEEGSLIKRSIRDLYNKDIDEVLVAGDDAYREAKDFMRMLMPSHAKNVKPYKEPAPVFIRFQVERQLAAMFSPQVVLRSGGYIVINQTEALVSIDTRRLMGGTFHSVGNRLLRLFVELNRLGTSVIIATHDYALMEQLNATNTKDLVAKHVNPVPIDKPNSSSREVTSSSAPAVPSPS